MPNEQALEEKLQGQLAFFPDMETDLPTPPAEEHPTVGLPSADQLDRWRICVLLSDIVRRFDGVLPQDWLYEIAVTSGYFSYFIYYDAIGALLEQGTMIECTQDGVSCYALTEAGRRNVRQARGYVPKYFRDKLHLTALRYVARQRALRDLHIHCEPSGSDWTVEISCTDGGKEMMNLRIHAPAREDAEQFGERILRNPARFFGKLLDLALTNEEEQYDLSDN